MEGHVIASGSAEQVVHDDVRRGPWTAEEDSMLKTYVTIHGEGRWNSVARCAGNSPSTCAQFLLIRRNKNKQILEPITEIFSFYRSEANRKKLQTKVVELLAA
jgi:hypothetical protein